MRKIYPIAVDCANCAAKMEAAVEKLPGISAVTVNYITQKMTLEFSDNADIPAATDAVETVCRRIDRHFSIIR